MLDQKYVLTSENYILGDFSGCCDVLGKIREDYLIKKKKMDVYRFV